MSTNILFVSQHIMSEYETFDLSSLKWKRRPFLVFAPNENDPQWIVQRDRMDHRRDAMRDRDMARVEIFGDSNGRTKAGQFDKATVDELRTRFDVRSDRFCVVLVGKDGTEKMRSVVPVEMGNVFSRIDSMPMRKREMDET